MSTFFDIEPVNLTPLICYQLFNSIKLHFSNQNYSYIKYGLNPRTFNEESFQSKNDKDFYKKLSDKLLYQSRYIPLVVINVFYNNKIWVGELAQKNCIDRAVKYRKYMSAFEQSFITDITNLILSKQIRTVEELYGSNNAKNYFGLLAANKINPLTAAVLNIMYYEKHLSNTPLSFVYKAMNFNLTRLADFIPKDKLNFLSDSLLYDLVNDYGSN